MPRSVSSIPGSIPGSIPLSNSVSPTHATPATLPYAQAIEQIFRLESRQVLATLIGMLGDIELAEDLLQDTWLRALEYWQEHGLPGNPGAWLTTTARNKAIDRLRRDKLGEKKNKQLAELLATEDRRDEADVSTLEWDNMEIADERLKLIFTCCHPALSIEAQVALTLNTLGGLSTEECAHAFLVPVPTMAQRLVRAKRKIRDAGIPYTVPDASAISERIDAVLAVIYLIFNEGYSSSQGNELVRHDLCKEAIRLGDVLRTLLDSHAASVPIHSRAEAQGLLALMVLHHSRRHARVGEDGALVTLEEQDRTRWDANAIRTGIRLLEAALAQRAVGPYQIQAAISALHAQASHADETDWVQIVALYEELRKFNDSPVIRLNHIAAIAMADGPWRALPMIDQLEREDSLRGYFPLYAARAELLRRAGRLHEATAAYARALEFCHNDSERLYLQRRLEEG